MSETGWLIFLAAYLSFGLGNFRSDFLIRWMVSDFLPHRVASVGWYLFAVLLWPLVAYMSHQENKEIMEAGVAKYGFKKKPR